MSRRWIVLWVVLVACLLAGQIVSCGDDDDTSDDDVADDDATDDDAVDDDMADDDATDDDLTDDDATASQQIDWATLEDKIRGSWVGQMAGVTWGAPTEFRYRDQIIPDEEVPVWSSDMINNGYWQDDIYVEIPFLEAMQEHGVMAGWDVFGDSFRDTRFVLAHANRAARNNLRDGIAAPDSGHYTNNEHCDDIDWQIEADYVGAMCPGLINPAVELAWRAGHVMNFGDGVLGGVFIAAMHAAAFFAEDLNEIIEAGRQALPVGSKYYAVIEDVIEWHAEGQTWEESWELLQVHWSHDDRCPGFENLLDENYNIDAILNGAYVLLGLLYGEGDFEESTRIAMRCGQDSDCNPSSVAGILGNWRGLAWIPEKFKQELQSDRNFLFTDYTLSEVIAIHLELAREVMAQAGAEVSGSGEDEVWTIPVEAEIKPPLLEQWPETANEAPTLATNVVSQDGLTLQFEATATDADGVLAYEWYFGDLRRAKGAIVSHTYNAAGTYDVIAYVTDNTGNTSWRSIPVTVPSP